MACNAADYDSGNIDSMRLRSALIKVQVKLREVDEKLATRRGCTALGKIIEAPGRGQAFLGASLITQRAAIDALMVVRLCR